MSARRYETKCDVLYNREYEIGHRIPRLQAPARATKRHTASRVQNHDILYHERWTARSLAARCLSRLPETASPSKAQPTCRLHHAQSALLAVMYDR